MIFQKIHPSEARRQKALQDMALCEAPVDPYLHSLFKLMQQSLRARTVLVSTLDQSHYWKLSKLVDANKVRMDALFCAQSTLGSAFRWGPVCADADSHHGDLYPDDIRFFASAPLHAPNGLVIGALSFVSECEIFPTPAKRQEFFEFATMAEGFLQLFQLKKQSKRLRETIDQVERKAMTDPLTQALNRSGLERFYVVKQHEASISRQGIAIFYCDLDFFKRINDGHGHNVGDLALKHIAATIQHVIGKDNIVVRQGGEEFVVLSTCADDAQAFELGESIRKAVNNSPLWLEDLCIPLTVSIGIAYAEPDLPLLKMLDSADKSLYQAKHTGRNKCIAKILKTSCVT